MVVVGGSGYFAGPFIGAVVVTLLPEWLRAAEGFYLIGYGTLVLVLMMFCPSGLLGLVEKVFPSSMAPGK
jgi:branched-chain amino acid transport system permease protein